MKAMILLSAQPTRASGPSRAGRTTAKQGEKGRPWLLVLLLLLVALAVACGSRSSAAPAGPQSATAPQRATLQADSPSQGIMVGGQGVVSAPPDVAVLTLGASARAATVSDASAQVADAMNRLLNSLKGNGVQEKDIQTVQFSVHEEREYRNGQSILVGFRATHTVRAKVREVAKAGRIIDDAVRAVGDLLQLQGIAFAIDDPTALRAQAREKAMAEARAKAEQLARLAGVTLGRPLSISEGTALPPPIPLPLRAAPENAGGQPIASGEMEVAVNVQVLYAIQ
ncbi:MAG TPA: SIMPL domain-containing protein [Dehalococcoidia bacterium]|nr:SIMPL domain-containing protein [Dehalococcoidia bacterium]